jgi:hypothetical protein
MLARCLIGAELNRADALRSAPANVWRPEVLADYLDRLAAVRFSGDWREGWEADILGPARPDRSAARLAETGIPILLLHGRQDLTFPAALVPAAARMIPSARAVVLEDAGHMAHIDQPDAWVAALREFLAAVDQARAVPSADGLRRGREYATKVGKHVSSPPPDPNDELRGIFQVEMADGQSVRNGWMACAAAAVAGTAAWAVAEFTEGALGPWRFALVVPLALYTAYLGVVAAVFLVVLLASKATAPQAPRRLRVGSRHLGKGALALLVVGAFLGAARRRRRTVRFRNVPPASM